MAIGERLKMARRMAGMSQQDVADKVGVSRMSISKYERELNKPGSDVLIRLAKALGVKVEYLLRPVEVNISVPAFRKRSRLRKKEENAIIERTRDWLERYLDLESLFGEPVTFRWPDIPRQVNTLNDAEEVALALREAWQLGFDPIDNLIDVLEDHGIKVWVLEEDLDDFDALTLWANEELPVIVVKGASYGDRQRLNLAHELGYLVLQIAEHVDEERAAFRFGAAFLVPSPIAYEELGQKRKDLDPYELHLLKRKYGLSMQAWIYRARDLDIISKATAKRLFIRFRREGWREEEPGDQIAPERPQRMKRLLLRALAENVLSRSRAAELLGKSWAEFWEEESAHHAGFPASLRR
jgi:transcriptional regulator with XRE-family HTH domain